MIGRVTLVGDHRIGEESALRCSCQDCPAIGRTQSNQELRSRVDGYSSNRRGRHRCVSLSGNGPSPFSTGVYGKRIRSCLLLQRLGAEEAGGPAAEDTAVWPTTKNSRDFPLALNFILLLSRVNWTAVFSGMRA